MTALEIGLDAQSTVVVGAQWGDEGKGKIVDLYAAAADLVVRFQGGPNAGHTLVVGGERIVLHLVPSGVLHPGKTCAIGPGCVIDPEALRVELDALEARGLLPPPERLWISRGAHLILPPHRRLDLAREKAAGAGRIGTTGRGVGPAYEDAVARRGVRFADVSDADHLRRCVEAQIAEKNVLFAAFGEAPTTVEEVVEPLRALYARLSPYLVDVGRRLRDRLAAGDRVLFEGAQGTLLDVLHGTYPFVTSSSTLAGNASSGAGLGPGHIESVVGVTKAYCTRVGAGPFPTELTDERGETLRAVGAEVGATTGRPRRCGWLDLPALRYAARLNGLTELAVTKLDVLGALPALQICVGYRVDGERRDELPIDPPELARAEPIYEAVDGWEADLRGARRLEDLPAAARRYLDRIEAAVEVPITLVSVGPDRAETLRRPQ